MAHFAELDDNNKVKQVIVVSNNELLDDSGLESEQKGIDFCVDLLGGRWVQTSYNANFRKNFASINSLYDPIRDAFISEKPYESWILNEDTCDWDAPTPYPTDGKQYEWNETILNWEEITFNS
jgi:hypothetical protein